MMMMMMIDWHTKLNNTASVICDQDQCFPQIQHVTDTDWHVFDF